MRLRDWRPPPLFPFHGWPYAAAIPFVNLGLLITGFAVLTPYLLTPTGVPLQLPRAITAEAVGGAGIVVTITEQQLVYLNGRLTTLEELPQQLAPLVHQDPAPTVLIRADHRVSMATITRTWDTCRQLGVARIAMATTKATE